MGVSKDINIFNSMFLTYVAIIVYIRLYVGYKKKWSLLEVFERPAFLRLEAKMIEKLE